jgi:hypothetical protein
MAKRELRVEDLVFGTNNGFLFVAVRREHLAEVQRLLEGLGIGSSRHFVEEGNLTVIHPHTNLAPDTLHALLLGHGWPSRRGGDCKDQAHKDPE